MATPTPTPEPTPAPIPAPTADPDWSEQVFAKDYTAGDGTLVLSVSYQLPLVRNTDEYPAGEAINQWYKTEGAARMAEAEELYELSVADYEVSTSSNLPFQATVQEMTYKVTRQDDTVVSVCREWYVNSGGAHPNVFRLSEQFDPLTGQKLGFADFFTDARRGIRRRHRRPGRSLRSRAHRRGGQLPAGELLLYRRGAAPSGFRGGRSPA